MIDFRKILEGLRLVPKATPVGVEAGDIEFTTDVNKFTAHNGTTASPLVTEAHTATLTNKSISGSTNTLTNIPAASAITGQLPSANGGTGISSTATFPTSGIVVTEAATETLTNKTLTSPVINTPTGIVKGDVGLGNVDNTSDVTKNAAVVTLTNKSISGSTNTLTNIPAATAITGILPATNGGTGVSSTATFPTSGVVVTEAATETLTNKTISGASNTISNVPDSALSANVDLLNAAQTFSAIKKFDAAPSFKQLTTPASPVAGYNAIYPKSDGNFYQLNSSGVEIQIGGGSAGSKNYLGTVNGVNGNGNFETNSTAGWGLLTVGAVDVTTKAVSGSITASAASITTFAATATGKLAGSYSLNTASAAAITQGQGFITSAFTIDIEDQAKMQTITGYYSVVSGATNLNFSGTSSNTWAVWIYDVTNSAWIQPAGVYNLVQGTGVGKLSATFQTSSNGTSYRLALVCVTATGGAVSMLWDDFSVGPQTAPMGPAVSDWTAYTPTVAGLGSGGTTQNKARWRRVGDSIEIEGYVLKDATAGTGASQVGISLPTGLTADSAKINGTQIMSVGSGYFLPGSTFLYLGPVIANDYSNIYFTNGTAAVGDFLKGSAVAAAAILSFTASIPITGWSSNTVMSNDTDTRVVAAIITGNPATVAANGIVIWPTVVRDTHASYNASTGQYTVSVTGFYRVTASMGCNAVSPPFLYAYVGGVQQSPQIGHDSTSVSVPGGTTTVFANANQTIDVRLSVASGAIQSGAANGLTIERLSGPATIAASEKVYLNYTNSSAATITANVTDVPYTTKVTDSHGAWNGSAFTAPRPGVYRLSFGSRANGTITNWEAKMYVNGTVRTYIAFGASTFILYGAGEVYLNTGDVLSLRYEVGVTTNAGQPSYDYITISSQG